MSRLVVSDASVFINFAFFDEFDKLNKLFEEIIVPEAVYFEVYQHGRYKPGSQEMLKAKKDGWIKVKKYSNKSLYDRLPSYIHEGEKEAIVLFIEVSGDVLLMDDRDGRRVAKNIISNDFVLTNSFEICDVLHESDIIDFNSIEMSMKLRQANFNTNF